MSESADQLSQGATALRLHRQLSAIWATGPGIQRLAAVNHSVIGIRMMVTSFVFFAIAGVLGMLANAANSAVSITRVCGSMSSSIARRSSPQRWRGQQHQKDRRRNE